MKNDMIMNYRVDDATNLSNHGEYRDVRFKIANHARRTPKEGDPFYSSDREAEYGIWNYYVTISEDMLPSGQFEEFWLDPVRHYDRSSGASMPAYDEYNTRWGQVHWHGGITFYRKHLDPDTIPVIRSVEIGCDFAHLWDEGQRSWYNREYVEQEARRTIDDLYQLYDFYAKCSWTGQRVPQGEIIEFTYRDRTARYSRYGLRKYLEFVMEVAEKNGWDKPDVPEGILLLPAAVDV